MSYTRPLLPLMVFSWLLAVLSVSPAKAQYPVYDVRNYYQLTAQLNKMAEDYQKQIAQLDEAIKQTGALTGPRGMGNLYNSALEQQLRHYLPQSWEQTMQMIGSGGAQSLYDDLYQSYDPISGAELYASAQDSPMAQSFDRRTTTNFSVLAASEQAYNNIERRIALYESLLEQLNQTPDLKASVDLQSRIAAENGLILTELMRLKTMQLQQSAAHDTQTLSTYRHAGSANRYDPDSAAKAFTPQGGQ